MANRFMGQSSFFASIANGALSQILQQRTEEREYGRQKEMADTRAKQNESFQQQQHALALERQNAAREGQDSEVDKLRKRHEWIMSLPEDQRKYYLGEGGGAKSYNYRSVVEKFFRNKEQDGRKVDPAHIDNVIFRLEQLGKEPTETMIDTVNKSIGDTKYAQLSLSEKSEKVDDMIWTWYNNPGIDPRSNGLQINQDARGNLSVAPEDRKMIMDMMFPGEDNAPTARSGEPGAVPGADNIVGPPAPVADEKPEPSPFETRDRKRLFSQIGSLNKLTQDQMDEHVYDYREVNEVISKVVSPDATMKPDEGDPERVSISQMVNDLMKAGVPPSLINDTVKMIIDPPEIGMMGATVRDLALMGKKAKGVLGSLANIMPSESPAPGRATLDPGLRRPVTGSHPERSLPSPFPNKDKGLFGVTSGLQNRATKGIVAAATLTPEQIDAISAGARSRAGVRDGEFLTLEGFDVPNPAEIEDKVNDRLGFNLFRGTGKNPRQIPSRKGGPVSLGEGLKDIEEKINEWLGFRLFIGHSKSN